MSVLLIERGNTAWKIAKATRNGSVEFLARGAGDNELEQFILEQKPRQIAAATVAPDESLGVILKLCEAQGIDYRQVKTSPDFGVTHCYKDYNRLGVDRWLTLVALASEVKETTLIIDAGTAVTADLIDSNGQHLGGWIAPGFKLMQESLVTKSNRLTVNDKIPDTVFAANTESAIWSGTAAALKGFCEQALHQASIVCGHKCSVVLTGGDAELLLQEPSFADAEFRPHLVLEGLNRWLQLRKDEI